MTAINFSIIRQSEQTVSNGLTEFHEVATGKVSPSDTATEKGITGQNPTLNRSVEADTTSSMTRSANHFQNTIAYFNLFIILQVKIGQVYVTYRLKTQPHRLPFGLNKIRLYIGMRRHRDAIPTLHCIITHHMVDMTMRINDLQRLQLMAVDEAEETIFFDIIGAPWIDNDTLPRCLVPYYIGIFRKMIENKRIQFKHMFYLFIGAKVRRFPYLCRLNHQK